MTRKEAAGVIKFEKACVLRQDTPRCNRDCKKCDLLLPTEDVLTAYDMAIEALEREPKSEWQKDHEILKAYSDGANGVLEEIRAEIRALSPEPTAYDVLRIIDKYKAESEDKA